jgi:hypothetical protein
MVIKRQLTLAAFVFLTIGTLAACEKIAIMPRPDIDRQGRPIERDSDRDRDPDSDRDRNLSRNDVIGTVERVDRANNEIQLRTTEAQVIVVKYDPATVVYDRDRNVGIDALRPRDQVLVTTSRNARGEQYADTIRLNDSSALGSRRSY